MESMVMLGHETNHVSLYVILLRRVIDMPK